ncbi:MAG: hypothetical protein H6R19_611 [Proteobacteria bacterium]|nr:hypothetical protein [Pseudomonadota bacterium]
MRFLTEKYRLLALLAGLLACGFLAISLAGYLSSREAIRRSISEGALPLTGDTIYSEIQRDLFRPVYISSLMAHDTFVRDWVIAGERDETQIKRYLQEMKEKYGTITSFLVSERSHAYYYANGKLKNVREDEPRDTWFFRVRSMSDPYEINVDPDLANRDTMTVFINYRLLDYHQNFIGAVGVGITLDTMGGLIERYQDRFQRRIFFADQKGTIVLAGQAMQNQRGSIRQLPGLASVAERILNHKTEPTRLEYVRDGHTILVNTRFIPELNWYLIVEQDEAGELAAVRRVLGINLAVSTGVILLALLIMYFAVSRYQRRLESMANTDVLTGLMNRQAFEITENQVIAAYQRNGQPVSAILLDLDLFKTINDTHGHQSGDTVLRELAQILRDAVRASDLVSRWGGEEFLVLLPNCELQQAKLIAEKLRATIEAHHFEFASTNGNITASLGVAQYQPGETRDSFFARADQALYAAKHAGRNQVISAAD